MNGSWRTVWMIAANRHGTKMGEGHLSDHCFAVLQGLVHEEAMAVMQASMGNINFFKPEPE